MRKPKPRLLAMPVLPVIVRIVVVGTVLLAASPAPGTKAIPAPGEPHPELWTYDWGCRNETEKADGRLDLKIGLRHLPAVSADGHLAIGVHENVADSEADHAPPVIKITPDVEWRSAERLVVYFVNLDTGRAERPIGVLPSPMVPRQYLPCAKARRHFDKVLGTVNDRLGMRPWAPLRALARDLAEPDRSRDPVGATTQKRAIGAASIEFRFPNLTIRFGKDPQGVVKHKVAMASYPGRTREDVPFGLLELEPAGPRTWLTDLWIEPGNGILVLRLMNAQFSDCVLGNAFDYFLRLSRDEADALCPECAKPRNGAGSSTPLR